MSATICFFQPLSRTFPGFWPVFGRNLLYRNELESFCNVQNVATKIREIPLTCMGKMLK